MLEIIENKNGLHLLFANGSPEEQSKALSRMKLDLENDGYPQYSGGKRRLFLNYVNEHIALLAEVVKNRIKGY